MRVPNRSRFGAPGLLATASCLIVTGLAIAGPGASGLAFAAPDPSSLTIAGPAASGSGAFGLGVAAAAIPPSAITAAEDDIPAPAVSLSAVNVPTRTRITVSLADFQPRSSATVTETYRYARNSIFTSKTVALGKLRLSRDGLASRSVTPVQSARAGTLTITGLDRAGTPITLTQRIQVG